MAKRLQRLSVLLMDSSALRRSVWAKQPEPWQLQVAFAAFLVVFFVVV